jgi:O-antigen/teichoic acid export membrane protein
VTPELTADNPIEPPKAVRSTAGMTTKVVKGSLWTLVGSVAPLAVAFISTPFVIRFLGTESYGVLLLVGLIPTYLMFADFGMGVASTKFASEAYGDGDAAAEAAYVKLASAVCLTVSAILFLPIFLFAEQVVPIFEVPPELIGEASLALRISTFAFVLSLLSGVVSAPQLARLRMDLNSIVNGGPKILMALATPLILYLGGGIIGAVWLGLFASVLSLVLSLYYSSTFLPRLLSAPVDRSLVRPLLVFGRGWFFASVAAALLGNMEKLILAKLVSVAALAHYSVAFALAGMVSIFSIALRQSLLPAFAQLSHPDKHLELQALVGRAFRLIMVLVVPGIVGLCVVAKPFFTLWAGEEFGRESTIPFYILSFGLFFSLLAYVPHGTIVARGRTDVFARLYWIELFSYAIVASTLIYSLGILGAAIAWTLRVIADSLIVMILAKRITRASFSFAANARIVIWSFLIMLPLMLAALWDNFSFMLLALAPVTAIIYAAYVWLAVIDDAEKSWINQRIRFWVRES